MCQSPAIPPDASKLMGILNGVWFNTYWVKNALGLYEGITRHAVELDAHGHFVALAGCGETRKTGADFRLGIVTTRDDCSDRGIGTALERGSSVLGIGAQYRHGYAIAPNSLGRRTRL